MVVCSACDKSMPADARLCPYCGCAVAEASAGGRGPIDEPDVADLGATVDTATDATVTTPGPSADAPTLKHTATDSSISDVHGRFLPGTALTERYRIVGLLGKGGMGEVYRADDLELNQSVALKFLPAHFAQDTARLQRFRSEVRMARQVSHPNVCRVYDIATYGDDVFLSMEYIDGEDLSSVLRRMGRPSEEKAIEWARQICLGLAAAHENRVLHRDLKPANVMIDGRGRARLTDFGLAGVEEEFTGRKDHAGTPAYMAPEQLIDGETTVKSDIYSLGLLLYELFTGKRMFEAESVDELLRLRRSDTLTTPTSVSGQIDPAIERAILRCLERDPSRRPDSAYEVLAALPGGDPLQAALAAGETPSPQMVANAGDSGAMRPKVAMACLFAFMALVIACVPLSRLAWHYVPLEKPPAVLAEKARRIIEQLGYPAESVDSAFGFTQTANEISPFLKKNDLDEDRWDMLRSMRPPAIHFWYRQSPHVLEPVATLHRITISDPPMTFTNMITVLLDPRGRLDRLHVVPPQRIDQTTTAPTPAPTNWTALFEAAELPIDAFKVVPPEWTPPNYCDEQRAWAGAYPEHPDIPIRIEAAAYGGLPTYFRIIGPWSTAGREAAAPTEVPPVMRVLVPVMFLIFVSAAVLMARRNMRLQRVDRVGANRFALTVMIAGAVAFILTTDHSSNMQFELNRIFVDIALALFAAGLSWLTYLALEPHVRRHWPETLISWSKMLTGKFRDPRIGRDLLVGGIFGLSEHLVFEGGLTIREQILGRPVGFNNFNAYHTFLGGRYLLGELLLPVVFTFPMVLLMLLFLFRLVLRRNWLAATAAIVFMTGISSLANWQPDAIDVSLIIVSVYLITSTLTIFLLVRYGLFAMVVSVFAHQLYHRFPITLDPNDWYFNLGLVPLLVLLALGLYGFHTALAGQPLLRDEVLDR